MFYEGQKCFGYNWNSTTQQAEEFVIEGLRQRLFGLLGADYMLVRRLSDGKIYKAEIESEDNSTMFLTSYKGQFSVRVELA